MSKRFRIALAQTGEPPLSTKDAAEMAERCARAAASGGADLLMLPELALCGYGHAELMLRLAMDRSQAVGFLAGPARRHDVSILAGYAERDGDRVFNAVVLVSPAGECVAHYRKMHLWGDYENGVFAQGAPGPVFSLAPGLKAGLLICFDLDHPVAAQDLVARGADILLVVSATSDGYGIVPLAQVAARAYENAAFFAFCNLGGPHHGSSFVGLSTVAAPDGAVLARAAPGRADMIFADIDPPAYASYRRSHRYADHHRFDLFPAPRGLATPA